MSTALLIELVVLVFVLAVLWIAWVQGRPTTPSRGTFEDDGPPPPISPIYEDGDPGPIDLSHSVWK
jgi:hypothetical protein